MSLNHKQKTCRSAERCFQVFRLYTLALFMAVFKDNAQNRADDADDQTA